jgi:alcohol dehydrogenase class IV
MADKYAQVAEAFGVSDPHKSVEENAHRAVDAVAQLSIDIGTAKSIEMLGGKSQDVDQLTDLALVDVSGIFGARPAKRADLKDMFAAAMNDASLYPAARL